MRNIRINLVEKIIKKIEKKYISMNTYKFHNENYCDFIKNNAT